MDKQLVLNKERVSHWIGQGAIPSDTMCDILKKVGITCKHIEERDAKREHARKIARKKGVPFTEQDRIEAAKKAEAEAKAREEAAKKAEEEAKAKAEAEAKAKAEAEAKAKEEAEAG
ncbi:MAG: 30S ribosomal protein S16, partial [Vulcanimicrobiota bacterium]